MFVRLAATSRALALSTGVNGARLMLKEAKPFQPAANVGRVAFQVPYLENGQPVEPEAVGNGGQLEASQRRDDSPMASWTAAFQEGDRQPKPRAMMASSEPPNPEPTMAISQSSRIMTQPLRQFRANCAIRFASVKCGRCPRGRERRGRPSKTGHRRTILQLSRDGGRELPCRCNSSMGAFPGWNQRTGSTFSEIAKSSDRLAHSSPSACSGMAAVPG